MAIGTNTLIEEFGTEVELTSGATQESMTTDGNFMTAASTNDWTNSDDVPEAMFKFEALATDITAAPAAGDTLDLFVRHIDVEGTYDTTEPDAEYPHTYLGTFPLQNVDEDQHHVIGPITLPNYKSGQTYHFYLRLNSSAGALGSNWKLWIMPKSVKPL